MTIEQAYEDYKNHIQKDKELFRDDLINCFLSKHSEVDISNLSSKGVKERRSTMKRYFIKTIPMLMALFILWNSIIRTLVENSFYIKYEMGIYQAGTLFATVIWIYGFIRRWIDDHDTKY